MKKSPILILGLVAALAGVSFSQGKNYRYPSGLIVTVPNGARDSTRPRRANDKAAEVRASVMVNPLSAERIAFDMLNQKRAENGLRRLAWSDDLASLARQHSQDMADHKYFNHRGRDGSMVSDRADRSGLRAWRSIGENIAFNRGYKDPIEVAVKLWMESTSHRHNLLDTSWKESAVGVAVASDGSYYFTQVFLLRK
jgi:uncharacterized protein YkwD